MNLTKPLNQNWKIKSNFVFYYLFSQQIVYRFKELSNRFNAMFLLLFRREEKLLFFSTKEFQNFWTKKVNLVLLLF